MRDRAKRAGVIQPGRHRTISTISSEKFAEKLAYWYFRLNGCLTIEDFIVHPDDRGSQRTDADILGVRFPYRSELATASSPMEDAEPFRELTKPLLFIAEVKVGKCHLNGPWTRPERENMERVLNALGAFPPKEVPRAAQALYEENRYECADFLMHMFALGRQINQNYRRTRPH